MENRLKNKLMIMNTMKEIINQSDNEVRTGKTKKKSLIGIVLVLVIVVAVGVLVIQERKNGTMLVETEENQASLLSALEKQELFEKIGKHIALPSEGEPLIVRVDNAEELKKKQVFFENSKDGDILIVYQEKALIYRPSEDILVNVGPVYMDGAQSSQVQKISLDVRNGSEAAGRARTLGEELDNKDEYEVVNIADASRGDYQESMLVNLTGKDISVLEQELGLKAIDTMPTGETDSSADVIIILGN